MVLIGPAGTTAFSSAASRASRFHARVAAEIVVGERGAVGVARRVGRVAGVACERVEAEHAAEARELPVVADRDDDPAVRDRKRLVGREVRDAQVPVRRGATPLAR